jgi:glyoxylase-like metal-dependent hydrolase (beta-lactamase superfamily II)
MLVVTKAGVIATDPIGLRRPQAVTTYIDEIEKVTSAPIKYVIYSHSHYDHIAGGKPLKDFGARFVAHKNARAQLQRMPSPDVVMPDEVVDARRESGSAAPRSSCSMSAAATPTTPWSCGCRRRS